MLTIASEIEKTTRAWPPGTSKSLHVRASLLATQFLGVVFARLVVGVEPLASMEGEEIARWLGPTFDLYLGGQ